MSAEEGTEARERPVRGGIVAWRGSHTGAVYIPVRTGIPASVRAKKRDTFAGTPCIIPLKRFQHNKPTVRFIMLEK